MMVIVIVMMMMMLLLLMVAVILKKTAGQSLSHNTCSDASLQQNNPTEPASRLPHTRLPIPYTPKPRQSYIARGLLNPTVNHMRIKRNFAKASSD